MQKNNKLRWNVRTLVFMAALVAMNLVLTRIMVVDLGPYRISVGSVCTIMAGLWLGPVAGGTCGFAADIVGCFMKGYTVNPLITLAAMLWGILPALARRFLPGKARQIKMAIISVAVVITGFLSSTVVTTAGLVWIMNYNFYAIIPGRLVQYVIMMPIYCVLTCILYFSPVTNIVTESIKPAALHKKAAI